MSAPYDAEKLRELIYLYLMHNAEEMAKELADYMIERSGGYVANNDEAWALLKEALANLDTRKFTSENEKAPVRRGSRSINQTRSKFFRMDNLPTGGLVCKGLSG
jgi:hypothetical protein